MSGSGKTIGKQSIIGMAPFKRSRDGWLIALSLSSGYTRRTRLFEMYGVNAAHSTNRMGGWK